MVELIWDAERIGTVRTSSGHTLTIGDPSGFAPDELLAMASAGCLMRAFLQAAAEEGVTILGYMATAHVETPSDAGKPTVRLHSYVVGADGVTTKALERLGARAREASAVARVLGDHLHTEWDLQVLHGA